MSAADVLNAAPAWVVTHSAVLIAVLPLLAAALIAVIPSARGAWIIALATTAACTVFAAVLLSLAWTSGAVSYELGGWAPPLGIEYRVDALNGAILLLIAVMGLACTLYAPSSVAAEIPARKQTLFYSAFLVCFAGLLGVVVTGDAFNLFVFLEISSLSTYVLVALGSHRDRRALTASYNYLILGTIGATFYVIGVGFLYMATGTLNFADMAERLAPLSDSTVVRAGFAFIVVGLGLKLAMFPLHTWLPNAYAFAPSFVTAFLASTATKAAFYALARFLFSVFSPDVSFEGMSLVFLLAPLGVAGMVIASFQAVLQTDVRRVFAYSSVAQVGYMIMGLAFVSAAGAASGLAAGLLHVFNHAMMKAALFMGLGAMSLRLGITRVDQFAGLGRVMPFTMAGVTIAGLSLIGVPLTVGFVSKWYLFQAALAAGWWWAVAALAVSSILAFIYVGRILEAAYLRPPPEHDGQRLRALAPPLSMLIPFWALVLANLYFGVNAEFTTELACRAADAVFAAGDACESMGAGR
ncbi:MAG: monovalent cation/H+ antiporter subunit D family protein [Maricaulaceae bacterium]